MFVGDASENEEHKIVNATKQALFFAVHFACLGALWVGVSWVAVAVCIGLYILRMFAITGGYHRYFSHHSFKTSRFFQFVLGFLGATSAQKGPIWWASHHRHHHKHSDQPEDVHSPVISGLYYAHLGWIMSSEYTHTKNENVKDLLRFPEIRWLDKYHILPPVLLGTFTYYLGAFLEAYYPALGTNALQMLTWGFFISTVLLYHGTFCINSLTHVWGSRRFKTTDDSRNNFITALITLGEGWHNNHHRYPGSERQGFYWWEVDVTHYILTFLSWFGIVWDLRTPPKRIYDEAIETAQGA